MSYEDLRGPLADVRSFLAQIDNTVDPVASQALPGADGGRSSHRKTRHDANGVGSAAKHLHYNGETRTSAEAMRRGQERNGENPSTNSMHPDQLRKLTRKWAIPIIVVTILGALASYVVSKRLTPMYAATGRVLVVAAPGNSGSGSLNINSTEATSTAASLLTEPMLLGQVISGLRLHTTPDALAKEVSAVAETNTELVDVIVDDPSPSRAAQIANALMNAYVAQVSSGNSARINQAGASIQSQISKIQAALVVAQQQFASDQSTGKDSSAAQDAITTDTTQLTALDSSLASLEASQAQSLNTVSVGAIATVPLRPASPNVLLNTAAGGLLALILASGIAYLLEFLDQGIRRADDVRERLGLPCLGVIPKFRHTPGRRGAHEPNHRHDEAVREAYRRLRINLLFAAPDDNIKSVVITSVRAGEGKTCTAANLAVALAGADRHVLLVDADLRKPDQHRLFGTTLEGGLSELILRRPTAAPVPMNGFRHTQFANLSLLTSGTMPPNPAELLASKRAIAVLNSIGPQEDLVVIDTAPAGLVTDALSVAAGASATILIVEAGKTKATQAAATIDALREVGANVIGVVLNKTSRRVGAGYSYRYGYPRYNRASASHTQEATADDLLSPQGASAEDRPPHSSATSRGGLTAPLQ
jgi:capsular exopolysaccharide synthesis family protein